MAKSKKTEKKALKRENWIASFNLIGEAKINDFTFKIDEQSEKSSWIYNGLNLGVDCGEKHGVVYCEMIGGYSADGNNVVYAHGKNPDGSDNFDEQIQVDWDDRLNPSVMEMCGDLSFITVGLEKTDKSKTFYKKFLSAYDAIAYINQHLEDGMIVNVKGNLRYSSYNDRVQVRKNITSIVLSKVDSADKYMARFTQSILINSDSTGLKGDYVDKDKSVIYVNARVLDYVKEINGVDIKGQFPFNKQFEFEMDFTKSDICKKIVDKLFKVRKDVTQITFEGDFIEGGAAITATLDDIPDDIKDLIECGVYTEEEALARCSASGSREQRMVLRRPMIRLVGDEKTPIPQIFHEKYTEDDLTFDGVAPTNNDDDDAEIDTSSTTSTEVDGDMSWLDNL